jgi:hypothetical protein
VYAWLGSACGAGDGGIVDLLLLEKNGNLCILVFYEVIALPFNALVGAFCSPGLCRQFEPTWVVRGHI